MSRLYNITVDFVGFENPIKFKNSTICLSKDGDFLAMNSEEKTVVFAGFDCRVIEIAAEVITIGGYTTAPCRYFSAYCLYAKGK